MVRKMGIKYWYILCSDGKWERLRGIPEADKLRKLNYGEYDGFFIGTWKDGEEAIYKLK